MALSLVAGTIPNFINGVSQQPYALRLASQSEEQVNGLSTIAEGLVKRPPTNHVARIRDRVADGTFLHIINRDETERYIVTIANGNLQVFDLAGVSKPVNAPDGVGYLGGTDFSAVTVADYTIIVNRGYQTGMTGDFYPLQQPRGLVYVRTASYDITYRVLLNDDSFTFTTADTGAPAIDSTDIAEHLRASIVASGTWLCQRSGSTLMVQRADGVDFHMQTQDSVGDVAMVAIKDRLQQFTDLPIRAFDGFQVEIVGTPNNAFDNFYVTFRASAAGSNVGVWVENAQPLRKINLDAATMPHLLIRESDGTFTFSKATWDTCEAGNNITAPQPSFVGNRINDVFFLHNRLGFISGESLIFSRSSELFNFWRATATQLLDTDPIDLNSTSTEVAILNHAIPFNEELILFSDEMQFVLSGSDVLTPKTTALNMTTKFSASSRVKPVGAGSFLYFSAARGTATSIHEFNVDGITRSKQADDVTSHVPHYVPPGCRKLAVSNTESILMALVDGEPNSVYVYKFYFQTAQQKVQSSWSKWTFSADDNILDMVFLDNALYLIVQRPDGLFLDRIDMDIGIKSGQLPYAVLLDRRVPESAVNCTYNAATKLSTIILPYVTNDELQVAVVGGGGISIPPGYAPRVTRVGPSTLTVAGDMRAVQFRVGVPYTFRYVLSPLVSRTAAAGGGQIADTSGRLQIRRLSINYAETGYFRVEVTPFRRVTYVYPFAGRVVGSAKVALGASGIETGSFRVPIMSQNTGVDIALINDTFLPCRFLTAEWEALKITRSRNIG